MAPATAVASSVGIESGQSVFRSGGTSADASTVGTYTFRDAAEPLIAKTGCFPTVDGVQCQQAKFQVFLLGGGNDRLYAHSRLASGVHAEGAAGADDIDVDAVAGTTASGGAGDDTIRVGANGGVSATGDGGDDHLLGNGAFSDLSGGGGDDLLVDVGGGYQSDLVGDGGADQLIFARSKGRADGGDGADTLVALDNGNVSGSVLVGGDGRDTISSAARRVTIDAGPGNDVVDTHGREITEDDPDPDQIMCGGGNDIVYADQGDAIAADCEQVRYAPAPPLPQVLEALEHYATTFG